MPIDQPYFKTGIIVTDLEKAAAEFTATLGVEWAPLTVVPLQIRTPDGLEPIDLRVMISTTGPTYLELIEAQPTGYYAAPNGGYLHHVGMWVDDLATESARLDAQGWKREAAGEFEGVCPVAFAFHASPLGMRLELGDIANLPAFEAWTSGQGLNL
jgi:hypothetical protein